MYELEMYEQKVIKTRFVDKRTHRDRQAEIKTIFTVCNSKQDSLAFVSPNRQKQIRKRTETKTEYTEGKSSW